MVSSRWRVRRGAISRWMAWISGVVCAETSVPKTACTEASRSPDIPRAATVFAKVAASGLDRDGLHLGPVSGHGGLEGGPEVGGLDLPEGR